MIPSASRSLVTVIVGSLLVLQAVGCSEPPRHHAVGLVVPAVPVAPIDNLAAAPLPVVGRVTLLNFWATWCGPCRRELPGLARMAASLASEGRFQLVAVCTSGSVGETPADLAAEAKEFLLRDRIAISPYVFTDPLTADLLSTTLGVRAIPATYLIGPDATVRRVWIGYRPQDEADMAAAIVALLKESPAQPE